MRVSALGWARGESGQEGPEVLPCRGPDSQARQEPRSVVWQLSAYLNNLEKRKLD